MGPEHILHPWGIIIGGILWAVLALVKLAETRRAR